MSFSNFDRQSPHVPQPEYVPVEELMPPLSYRLTAEVSKLSHQPPVPLPQSDCTDSLETCSARSIAGNKRNEEVAKTISNFMSISFSKAHLHPKAKWPGQNLSITNLN